MKTITCIILVTLLLGGCGVQETADQKSDQPPESLADLSEAEVDSLYTEAASKLVTRFGSELKTELMHAMNLGGAFNAIDVCVIKGQELVSTHSNESWSIKRVSEKWRNIADRPDTTEINVLKQFADPAFADDFVGRWSGPDSARVFHFYKKIMTSQMCLQCHGDLQTVDLDLWKKVKLNYPYDKATGYQVGDLRGMFVVSGTYPDGIETARLLASGANMAEMKQPDTTAMADSATTTTE